MCCTLFISEHVNPEVYWNGICRMSQSHEGQSVLDPSQEEWEIQMSLHSHVEEKHIPDSSSTKGWSVKLATDVMGSASCLPCLCPWDSPEKSLFSEEEGKHYTYQGPSFSNTKIGVLTIFLHPYMVRRVLPIKVTGKLTLQRWTMHFVTSYEDYDTLINEVGYVSCICFIVTNISQ